MSALTPIYRQWLDETQKRLADEYKRLNFRASGNYERQLEPFIQGDRIGMLGANYARFMAQGRGPTAPTKRGRLFGVILQWVKDKGITPRGNITQRTLAWLIALKIDREGYKVTGREGVVSNVINDQWIAELFRRIGQNQIETVRIELRELLKAAA
jgi:hypothetical protein